MRNDNDNDGYDFGEDAGVIPQADPAFDAWIAAKAPALNAPNTAPRDEMWAAIEAARRTAADAEAGLVPGVTPLRPRPWRLMAVIAAALLLGVAIDRVVLSGTSERGAIAPVATLPPTPADAGDPSRLYRLAATQTLTQAEALLTAFRAHDVSTRNPVDARLLGDWGRQVLGSTRLLLDSPAGADPQLRGLFNDLELVLVQIIQLSGAPLDESERALIHRALEERDLLPRIRTVVPAGPATSASSDD